MTQLYDELTKINERPDPFEFYTAETLWTDEHISRKMLEFHLNESVDLASRRTEFIDRSVDWIAGRFDVGSGSRIVDFGCGPGLYASRLASQGAKVAGIDFSARSLDYARSNASERGLDIKYVHQNYLKYRSNDRFDLAMLIYCDLCPLSPDQRRTLLSVIHEHLDKGGALLMDVLSLVAFDQKNETVSYAPLLLDGFWSADNYFGFMNSFRYSDEKLLLDKYTIIERNRIREIYNWLQCFSIESLKDELGDAGFTLEEIYADVAGRPYDPAQTEFAVVARKI